MTSSNTTFFSYSRSDSETALKIAKDLRDGGANIWLDQLDIPAGTHWDSSIEKALNASSSTIVLLSPESVTSNNVMDEVSYALENGKQIIPVMIKECNIPFRLRRLQRIDITQNYEAAIRQLLQALTNTDSENETGKINSELTNESPIENKGSHDQPKKDSTLEYLLWEKAKAKNSKTAINHYLSEYPNGKFVNEAKKLLNEIGLTETSKIGISSKLIIGGILVTLLLGGLWFWFQPNKRMPEPEPKPPVDNQIESNKNQQEEEDWAKARNKNDSIGYKNYIKNYPTGDHLPEAKRILDSIVTFGKDPHATEQQIWKDIIKGNTLDNYLTYLSVFPDGIHRKIAMDSIKTFIKIGNKLKGGIIIMIDSSQIHGVVVDTADLGKMEWPAANQKCKEYMINGYSGWRLPTKQEIRKIYRLKDKIGVFKEEYYWSSTPDENNPNQFYVIRIVNGYTFTNQPMFKIGVRAVRDF